MSTEREIQLCTFEILKEVVRVCEKHEITYFLSFGTLLGGVRHKGFIPWDNDIDITMPIKDYRRFLKIAPKVLPKDLFVQTYKSEHNFNLLFTQIRANNTTSLPVKYKNWNIHWGMHIDIFPLAGVFESKFGMNFQRKAIELCRALVYKEFLQVCDSKQIERNKKLKVLYVLPRFLRVLLADVILRFVLRDHTAFNFCSELGNKMSLRIDSTKYVRKTVVEFEGEYFAAPEDYDYILTMNYGDYMTPPPVSERSFGHTGTHGEIIYDHTTDFKKYIEN